MSEALAAADALFLTVSDDAIAEVCARIAKAGGFRPGQAVFHCSGALASEMLAPARRKGAAVASLHPLQSFPAPAEALRRMKGAWFAFEGDARALPMARRIVKALGGNLFRLKAADKALYHAAACVLSNYLVALADAGGAMLSAAGLSRRDAQSAALPLVRGTLENLQRLGSPRALTGPISRGDAETVGRHLAALSRLPPEFAELYRCLGQYTICVALRKGSLSAAAAARLRRRLRST